MCFACICRFVVPYVVELFVLFCWGWYMLSFGGLRCLFCWLVACFVCLCVVVLLGFLCFALIFGGYAACLTGFDVLCLIWLLHWVVVPGFAVCGFWWVFVCITDFWCLCFLFGLLV